MTNDATETFATGLHALIVLQKQALAEQRLTSKLLQFIAREQQEQTNMLRRLAHITLVLDYDQPTIPGLEPVYGSGQKLGREDLTSTS